MWCIYMNIFNNKKKGDLQKWKKNDCKGQCKESDLQLGHELEYWPSGCVQLQLPNFRTSKEVWCRNIFHLILDNYVKSMKNKGGLKKNACDSCLKESMEKRFEK